MDDHQQIDALRKIIEDNEAAIDRARQLIHVTKVKLDELETRQMVFGEISHKRPPIPHRFTDSATPAEE